MRCLRLSDNAAGTITWWRHLATEYARASLKVNVLVISASLIILAAQKMQTNIWQPLPTTSHADWILTSYIRKLKKISALQRTDNNTFCYQSRAT